MNINNFKDSDDKSNIPKISIGLPVYNGEAFIDLTLDSILSQSFEDFELIISDNASTDTTEKICREYAAKDKRVKYIRQKENLGGVYNFKYVLDKSVGKYFMWIAADDLLGNKEYLNIINNEISDKYDYYFTEVSTVNNLGEVIEPLIMDSFKNCKTQLDFLAASLSNNAMQLYSLFLKENLIKDWRYIEICRNLSTCNEGLFVHAINATRKGKFLNKAIKLFRSHKNSWSMNVAIRKIIVSQVIYTLRSIHLIMTFKHFSFLNRIFFSIKKFYLTLKALSYFTLYALGRSLGLDKIFYLKKIIRKIRK